MPAVRSVPPDANASTYRPDEAATAQLDPEAHDAAESAYLLVFEGASSRAEHGSLLNLSMHGWQQNR